MTKPKEFVGPEDFMDALGDDVKAAVTLVHSGCYRTWVKEGDKVNTKITDYRGVAVFMEKHQLTLGDLRVEPKEWNRL